MRILIDEFEHFAGEYRLKMSLYRHSNGEYSYETTIDRGGALVSRTTSHKFKDIWLYVSSFKTRVTEFYNTYSDGYEN
jgi:hypothetical protein